MGVFVVRFYSVPGYRPDPSELEPGEFVMNTADRKLFSKHVDGSIIEFASSEYTITNVPPTNVGNTNSGHIWYVY